MSKLKPGQSGGGAMKPQLHQSQLDMMSKCGIQFQRRYGVKFGVWHQEEIVPPAVALILGSSVHKSVEVNLRNKIDNGELLSLEEAQTAARDEFAGLWDAGVLLSEDEAVNTKETKGTAQDMAIQLAGLHYKKVAPSIKYPVSVEENFVIELTGYDFDLAGTFDVRESNNGTGFIRDTKTKKQSPNIGDIQSIQMGMYSMGHKVIYGKLPDKVFLDVLLKHKTPKVVILEEKPDDSWMDPVKARIIRFAEVINAVKAGHQVCLPAQADGPSAWVCTRKWCGYAESCEFWSGR